MIFSKTSTRVCAGNRASAPSNSRENICVAQPATAHGLSSRTSAHAARSAFASIDRYQKIGRHGLPVFEPLLQPLRTSSASRRESRAIADSISAMVLITESSTPTVLPSQGFSTQAAVDNRPAAEKSCVECPHYFRTIRSSLFLAGALALGRNSAQATSIASDDFLTGGVWGLCRDQRQWPDDHRWHDGLLHRQPQRRTQAAGWASGTGAFAAQTGGLTNPNVVNLPTSNDGSLTIVGNSFTRSCSIADLCLDEPHRVVGLLLQPAFVRIREFLHGDRLCRGGSIPYRRSVYSSLHHWLWHRIFQWGSLPFYSTGGLNLTQRTAPGWPQR